MSDSALQGPAREPAPQAPLDVTTAGTAGGTDAGTDERPPAPQAPMDVADPDAALIAGTDERPPPAPQAPPH